MEGFFSTPAGVLAITLAQTLALLVPVLLAVAYLTYAERKVLGAMQLRRGPNVVGPFGLFQPFADAIKAVMKETIVPSGANRLLFMFAPMLTFMLAMLAWAVIPVIAGWASNSKYAFLGALRSAAQMVSYEVSMGFVIVTVLMCVGSLNLSEIVR